LLASLLPSTTLPLSANIGTTVEDQQGGPLKGTNPYWSRLYLDFDAEYETRDCCGSLLG
jgi:hypothetical protein